MELKSLQEIFNEKNFRVPDYQRGYSWDKKELEDLWRDINVLDGSRYHYTGVLSVTHHEDGAVYIVDGQQRLTSLIILINAICKSSQVEQVKIDGNGECWLNDKNVDAYIGKYLHTRTGPQGETKLIFSYEADDPSATHFRREILELEDDVRKSGVPRNTLYTKKLSFAKEFFEGKIKDLDLEGIATILKKLTTQLKFNYYSIDSQMDEFVAFESMNNRGKKLSDLELLKNRLMYLSTLLTDTDDDGRNKLRKSVNEAWKTIYEYLGKNPNNTLNDDSFLKTHWIMWFHYRRTEGSAYRKDLLDKHFTAEQVQSKELRHSDIKKYVVDIQKSVESYYYFNNPQESDYGGEVKEWLNKIARLDYTAYDPLIVSAITHVSSESDLLKILKCVEPFIFVTTKIRLLNSNYKNSKIHKLARVYHRNPIKFGDINELIGEIKTISGDYNKFDDSETPFDKVYEDRYKGNFYELVRRGLKYFLYEYELYLQRLVKGSNKVDWENVDTGSIEHIYPQKPSGGWESFSGYDGIENNLGNLLLLSQQLNASLNNDPFERKKEVYSENSYSAIKVSKYEDWMPESVADRYGKMLDFLIDRWGLVCDDNAIQKHKEEILGAYKSMKQSPP